MEEKLVTTRELKVGEFYTYRGDDEKEKNLSRVGNFTNSTSGPIDMIYVAREIDHRKGQKSLGVISLKSRYSLSDECTEKIAEDKYISLEKGERDLDKPVWYPWNNSTNIDLWFSEAGCVLDRKLKRAFPEYKMCAPNMMFVDIVVEVRTGIILSIDKVIGNYVISRLYYDKENSLGSHEKYVILSKAGSRFRQAIKHEISLLSNNLPVVEGSTEEDSMYLDYLRTVLDNKLNNRVMQRLEAGCTFKVGYKTFIGPGMYLFSGEHIPTLLSGTKIKFEEVTTSMYPICSVEIDNNAASLLQVLDGREGYFDPKYMKFIRNFKLEDYFAAFNRKESHGYLVNILLGDIIRFECEKAVSNYLQTNSHDNPVVERIVYKDKDFIEFTLKSSNFGNEVLCNCKSSWRPVSEREVPMLDEIFEQLEKSSRKKVVERPITVMVNGKEVKVSEKLKKELKKLVKE